MTCIAELDSDFFILFFFQPFLIFEIFPSVWVVSDGDCRRRVSTC